MDDMRLYNRALSAAEVMALYDGTAVTPTPVTYTVIFDLNGADGAAPAGRQIAHGDAVGGLPTVTRTGYAFLGWFTAASGGAQISASTAVTGNVTCYAQWRVNSYAMTFDANGGVGGTVKTQDYGTALTAPAVTRTGYTFTGWSPSVPSTVPAADATYTAQWLINSYTVTFDANGGTAGTSYMARNHGATLGSLPIPVRDGYEFLGWFTAASGGTQVYASTAVTGNVTYYAQWQEEENALWDEDEAFDAAAAAVFDGFLVKDGEVCGSIQVKAAKAGRNGAAKLAATVTRLGVAQKLSYKGMMGTSAASDDFTPGVATLTCSGQPNLMLRLGRNALWGEMGSYEIEGARNVFAKSGDPKAGALSKWLGAYTLVLETVDAAGSGSGFAWGYSGLTVTVGAKGKVKVQGTLVDGAKVNVASQLLVGDGRCCIPVVVPLYAKKGGFGFNLWLQEDGSIEAGEISKWDATVSKTPFTAWWGENVPVAKTGAALPASLSFMLAGEPDVAGMEVLYDFLPWEVVFATGARWTLPTAGNVKYDREADDYVDAKDSSNPSGLKLTYVAKMGTFKGSFKMYAVDASGRLKKYTANVSGVIVGRQGYGTASVKGVGSWPVLIE